MKKMNIYGSIQRRNKTSPYELGIVANSIRNPSIKQIQVDILWWIWYWLQKVIRWICLLLCLHLSLGQIQDNYAALMSKLTGMTAYRLNGSGPKYLHPSGVMMLLVRINACCRKSN